MPPTPRHPWLILAVVFLGSVAAVLAQFAAPPLMPLLMADFGIDMAQASSLMSVFSVTGLLLALPAGVILGRVGPVATGAMALASVVLGSAMGALAPDYSILLVSRLVQGVGVGLIGVTAPAVVAATFPPERRGTPMGIWATWVPLGGLCMYIAAPLLAVPWGWQAAWWLAGGVALAAGVLWVAVLATGLPASPGRVAVAAGPGGPADAPGSAPASPAASSPAAGSVLAAGRGSAPTAVPGSMPAAGSVPASLRVALANRDIWLLAATFGLFATAAGGFNTFLPTFLVGERGLNLDAASQTAALVLVGAMAGSLASGFVSDRIGSRRTVYTGSALALAVLWVVPYIVDPAVVPIVLLAIGIASGALPAAIFASAPDAMRDPRLAGAGMAALMVGQNGGMVLGPAIFGTLVTATAWSTGGLVLGGVTVVAALVGWRAHVR